MPKADIARLIEIKEAANQRPCRKHHMPADQAASITCLLGLLITTGASKYWDSGLAPKTALMRSWNAGPGACFAASTFFQR